MDDPKSPGANIAQTTADLVKDLHKPQVVEIPACGDNPACQVLAVPMCGGGIELVRTTRFSDDELAHPKRVVGTATLGDLPSMIAHIDRFKNEESALFAANSLPAGGAALRAVYDYHERVTDAAGECGGRADWCDHKAVYNFPLSKEWKTWTGLADKPLDVADFAAFLEDNILDVMEPPAFMADPEPAAMTLKDRELVEQVAKIEGRLCGSQKLMELSRGLAVFESAKVENFTRLDNGEGKLTFHVEHQDAKGKPLTVPSCFLIAIPVFEGGEPYRLLVRLRYRLRGGAVTWNLLLHRAERALEVAFTEACDEAARKTGLPLFYGTPE